MFVRVRWFGDSFPQKSLMCGFFVRGSLSVKYVQASDLKQELVNILQLGLHMPRFLATGENVNTLLSVDQF